MSLQGVLSEEDIAEISQLSEAEQLVFYKDLEQKAVNDRWSMASSTPQPFEDEKTMYEKAANALNEYVVEPAKAVGELYSSGVGNVGGGYGYPTAAASTSTPVELENKERNLRFKRAAEGGVDVQTGWDISSDPSYALDTPKAVRNEVVKKIKKKKAWSDDYSDSDILFRIGEDTGELEVLDPTTNTISTVNARGLDWADVRSLSGDAVVMTAEMIGGLGGAITSLPGMQVAGARLGASGGAAVGEAIRLYAGIRKGVNDELSGGDVAWEASKSFALTFGLTYGFDSIGKAMKLTDDLRTGTLGLDEFAEEFGVSVKEAETIIASFKEEGIDLFLDEAQKRGSPELMRARGAFEAPKMGHSSEVVKQDTASGQAIEDYTQATLDSVQTPTPEGNAIFGQRVKDSVDEVRAGRAATVDEATQNAADAATAKAGFPDAHADLDELGNIVRRTIKKESDEFFEAPGAEFARLQNELADMPVPNTRGGAAVSGEAKKSETIMTPRGRAEGKSLTGEEFLQRTKTEKLEIQKAFKDAGMELDEDEMKVLNRWFDPNATLTYDESENTIRYLNRLIQKTSAGSVSDTPSIGTMKRIRRAMVEDQDAAIKANRPDLLRRRKKAKDDWAEGKRRFNNDVVEAVLKEDKTDAAKMGAESVMANFVRPYAKERGQTLGAAIGNNPEAKRAVKKYVAHLYQTKVVDGGYSRKAHEKFVREYKHIVQNPDFFDTQTIARISHGGNIVDIVELAKKRAIRAQDGWEVRFESSLAGKSPSDIYKTIMGSGKDGARERIEYIKNMSPDLFSALQAEAKHRLKAELAGLRSTTAKAADTIEGLLKPDSIEVLETLYGKPFAAKLKTLVGAIDLVGAKGAKGALGDDSLGVQILSSITRPWVGVISKKALIRTAIMKLNETRKNEILWSIIQDPKKLNQAQQQMVKPTHEGLTALFAGLLTAEEIQRRDGDPLE